VTITEGRAQPTRCWVVLRLNKSLKEEVSSLGTAKDCETVLPTEIENLGMVLQGDIVGWPIYTETR